MKFYLDVLIKPDEEIRLNFLLNSIYTKLHKALCDLKTTSIGVSFPKHKVTLGNVLRIHGNKSTLNDLQGLDWLDGMNGYCSVSEISPVPSGAKFCTVSRIQTTMSQSKLNRLLKRGSITEDEVKKYKARMFTKGLDNPYVELVSCSNGHRHRRYIEFGALIDFPVEGEFDQFGLSKTATVPWF